MLSAFTISTQQAQLDVLGDRLDDGFEVIHLIHLTRLQRLLGQLAHTLLNCGRVFGVAHQAQLQTRADLSVIANPVPRLNAILAWLVRKEQFGVLRYLALVGDILRRLYNFKQASHLHVGHAGVVCVRLMQLSNLEVNALQ